MDNNSTDQTRTVAEQFLERFPHSRYLFVEKQGLAHARNVALREACAPVIAYLDDEAAASADWLSDLVHRFESIDPRPACVGGPVYLDWEGGRPPWLPNRYLNLYTHLDLGPALIRLNDRSDGIVQGANMAFDRELALRLGGFSESTGRKGSSLISGEDTEFLSRLKSRGYSVYYSPNASVHHLVLPQRRNKRYFKRRLLFDGKSQILIDILEGRLDRAELLRRLPYDTRVMLRLYLRALWQRVGRRPVGSEYPWYEAIRRRGRVLQIIELMVRRPAA
jgi:GT2 family glycosyltransferase